MSNRDPEIRGRGGWGSSFPLSRISVLLIIPVPGFLFFKYFQGPVSRANLLPAYSTTLSTRCQNSSRKASVEPGISPWRKKKEIEYIGLQETEPESVQLTWDQTKRSVKTKSETLEKLDIEALYREYGPRLLNMIYRMTRDEETARDLLQDVFLRAYQKQHQFQGHASAYTWIYRMAINLVLNHLKREKRRRWLQLLDQPLLDVLRAKPEGKAERLSSTRFLSGEEKLLREERERIVWQVIQQLPDKLRVPFILYRYEGHSYQEIAQVMGLSHSAVEARLHRAKKQFIKKMKPWLDKI